MSSKTTDTSKKVVYSIFTALALEGLVCSAIVLFAVCVRLENV